MTISEIGVMKIENAWPLWNNEQICKNSTLTFFINKTLKIIFILGKIYNLVKSENMVCTYIFSLPFFLIWHNVMTFTKRHHIQMLLLYRAAG